MPHIIIRFCEPSFCIGSPVPLPTLLFVSLSLWVLLPLIVLHSLFPFLFPLFFLDQKSGPDVAQDKCFWTKMGERRPISVSDSSVAGPPESVRFASSESVEEVVLFHSPESILNVPLFEPYYWSSTELLNKYVCEGMLPGWVPLSSLQLSDWDIHFVIPSGDLFRRRGETTQRARTELLRILHQSLHRVRTGYPVPFD